MQTTCALLLDNLYKRFQCEKIISNIEYNKSIYDVILFFLSSVKLGKIESGYFLLRLSQCHTIYPRITSQEMSPSEKQGAFTIPGF